MQEGLQQPLSSPLLQPRIGLRWIPSLPPQSHSWQRQRGAWSPASPGEPGTSTPGRKPGTHRPRAQTLAGLGALWRDRVGNKGDLCSEMARHCFCSSQVVCPNARSISSFGSCRCTFMCFNSKRVGREPYRRSTFSLQAVLPVLHPYSEKSH